MCLRVRRIRRRTCSVRCRQTGQAYLSNASANGICGADARTHISAVPGIATAQLLGRSVSLQLFEQVERMVDEEIAGPEGRVVQSVEAEPPPHEAGAGPRVHGGAEVDD